MGKGQFWHFYLIPVLVLSLIDQGKNQADNGSRTGRDLMYHYLCVMMLDTRSDTCLYGGSNFFAMLTNKSGSCCRVCVARVLLCDFE